MTQSAIHAIKAAKLWNQCGEWTMTRYAEKHGVPARLLEIAKELEDATKVGF